MYSANPASFWWLCSIPVQSDSEGSHWIIALCSYNHSFTMSISCHSWESCSILMPQGKFSCRPYYSLYPRTHALNMMFWMIIMHFMLHTKLPRSYVVTYSYSYSMDYALPIIIASQLSYQRIYNSRAWARKNAGARRAVSDHQLNPLSRGRDDVDNYRSVTARV